MTAKSRATILLVGVLMLAVSVATRAGQGNPVRLPANEVAQLLGHDRLADRAAAVFQIQRTPALLSDDGVRTALLGELRRVNRTRMERYARWEQGELGEPDEYSGEHDLAVIALVVSLRDVTTIPDLVGAVDTGASVYRALTEFPDDAVPALLSAWTARGARSERRNTLMTAGILHALETVVASGQPVGPLRQQVVDVTRRVLEAPEDVTVLRAGMHLALVLRDPELVDVIEAMAADVGEVYRRGIQEPEAAERIQQLAKEGYAKIR